mgnify:CR=1 FL=1
MAGVLQYFVNEAESGSAPTALVDTGSSGLDLAIDYGAGGVEAEWVAPGFRITASGNTSTAGFRAALNAALVSALSGSGEFTIIFRQAGFGAATPFSTIFQISDGVTVPLEMRLADIGYVGLYVNGEAAALDQYGGDVTVFRVDTSLATANDRVKLDVREFGANVSRDMSFNAVSQNTNLGDLTGHTLSLLNSYDQNSNISNPAGVLAYFEIYNRALTDQEVDTVLTELENNFDEDPLEVPTLAFVSAPSLSAVTSSGFDLALTTNLAATIDVLITLTADQPSDAAFDAATFGGNSGAYSVYSESLTGLNSETTYYVHVRATDGTTTLYAYDSATTLAVQNAILSINGGNPIRLNQTGIVVIWDGGATGTTTTTINGVAQANHTVISDTETRFDFVWPATRYGQTETLDINGTQFVTPPILPPVGYDYVTVSGYNEAEPGTIPTNQDVANPDQAVWDTEGGKISLSPQVIPSFKGTFDGDITIAIVDAADGAHSSFDTYYYQAPADAVPDQFDVGLDVVDAEPGAEITGSFVVAGIDAGVSVTFAATASMLVSTDGATWVTSITRQLGETVFHKIDAGPVGIIRTGGISAGGVVDSKTVTTRDASVPVITTQPGNQSVTAGVNASFTAAATNVANWQWQKDTQGNGTFADIAGATSATLSYPTTLANNGDQFRAVATSSEGGTTTTNAATLTVIAQAATLTTDVLRDASGALLASQSIDVEVWTPGAGATQLWSGQIATDAAGIGTVTNNNMGAVGDTVDIRFPGLQNSFNSVRYILQ